MPIVRNLENLFLIDWLSITFHGLHLDQVEQLLDFPADVCWSTENKFMNGYPMDTSFGHIHISWGADDARFYTDTIDKDGTLHTAESKARSDMGICLNMSGQGCRCFEEFSRSSWMDFMDRIFHLPASVRVNVTRLDLAYDDHSGLLDIWRVKSDVEERNYRSKARKAKILWSDNWDNDIRGLTIYVGSEKSPVFIRIYNKAAERGWGPERHWIRVELQLRDERALEAFKQLWAKESIGVVASGIVRNYLCFLTPTADSNRARWPVAEYWQRILEGMEKIRLWFAPGEEYNFSKVENHLLYQYGQVISLMAMLHEGSSYILDRAKAAHPVLKPKYQKVFNEEMARRTIRQEEVREMMKEFGFDSVADIYGYAQTNFAQLLVDDPDCPFGG